MKTLWTIGHSTHPIEEFVDLLKQNEIAILVDVRTVPKSRRNPQFADDALAQSLPASVIDYLHMQELGGWRKVQEDSPNGAWRNDSFQGYADYMLTDEFAAGIERLSEIASERRAAVMCSEAVWWRCHRRMISDRMVASGWQVCHISSTGKTSPHSLADFAVERDDGKLIYPA